jgi:hypothetical protein
MGTPKSTAVPRLTALLVITTLLLSVLSLPAQAAPATAPSDQRLTSTPTPLPVACSPVSATISAPFTYDGPGTFCWQIASIPNFIFSYNVTELTVNGVNFATWWVPPSGLPPKINGFWYIKFTGIWPWSHFEAK